MDNKWNINDIRTWKYIVSDVLTKYSGIGQYLDSPYCQEIAKYMMEEWKDKLCFNQGKPFDYENANIQPKDFASKDEPKFKVGDWVVDNCGYVWKVEGTINQFYILEGIDGGESRPTIEWVNKTFHLWTIQDAKDGDVFAFDNETIVIFKDLYNATTFHSYCHIEDGVFTASEKDVPDWWEGKGFQPATKEQRDTLMKAMTDAGYTFDFKKKELRKIL